MEPACVPTSVRCPGQVVPLAEEAKNSCPGCRAYDGGGLTKCPQESRSTRPSGSTSTGALYPPPRGKRGLTGMIGPQVLPPSVDRWMTVFMSPALNAQLPFGAHRNLT